MSSELQRSATRRGNAPTTMHRSASRRVVQEKKKTAFSEVEQGLKVLYPLEKNSQLGSTDFDIVLVPGLGAHPENSWKWKGLKDGHNWTTEGLVRDFPRARVLLFMYQSAWIGSLQVHQFMDNIAKQLLTALRKERAEDEKRAIVFIGHSMGGIVIARAVHMMANMERDDFPLMFEATAACIFFGTPFGGAETAAVAAMYANVAEKFKQAKASKLLDLLKPGNEELRTLKDDFVRLAMKLNPAIDLFCFWEEQETDFAELAGLPTLFGGIVRLAVPTSLAEFVSRKSATLDGVREIGLACNHRDLVKFENGKDKRWSQIVRDKLKPIIQRATLNAGKRMKATRGLDATMISDVLKALEGAQPEKRRKVLARTFAPSSWIPKETLCLEWLAPVEKGDERQCLWIRGPEGRGKTGATMAALQEIENQIDAQNELFQKTKATQDLVLLTYFFCEATEDYATAEDLLKSLIRQLISQQQKLASYAKVFASNAKEKGKDENSKDKNGRAQVHMTVENLWQVLQDMLADESICSRVYFVLNNLHVLPEQADSTKTLMRYINADLENSTPRDQQRVSIRWFITSRDSHTIIKNALKTDNVRSIDLEDEKYGNQVQMELREHAKMKIAELSNAKKYNKAIAYFASSLIGKRAQNAQWIDITCVQLKELSPTESDLKVRRVLETIPQDLGTLLRNSWIQIFDSNQDDVDKIKEILRSLVLTYDDPTEPELAILAGLSSTEEERLELPKLVQKCKPLLSVKQVGKANVVYFMNAVVKTYLLKDAETLLGLAEDGIKWQHGVLALRAFAHVREAFNFQDMSPESEPETSQVEADGINGADSQNEDAASEDDEDSTSNEEEEEEEDEEENEDEENEDEENEEEENEEQTNDEDEDEDIWDDDESEQKYDREFKALSEKAEHYMVKHWLRHASKATIEIAEDLSQEKDFWSRKSPLRRRWLIVYSRVTSTDDWDFDSFTALHVVASFGYRQLVSALIRNGHEDEVKIHDTWYNIPLHLAAWYGRSEIVEELLLKDETVIDDGAEEERMTPLSMAANKGKVKVMRQLLQPGRNANPNTIDGDLGPVINAAIQSGNREAVELLVEEGHVSLSIDRNDFDSPLATAALLSDISMFQYLIEKYANKLPEEEYSKALVKSAEAGRVEVFQKLLEFSHQRSFIQRALDVAAEEDNWELVRILLDKGLALNCDEVFNRAATNPEDLTGIMNEIWTYSKGLISSETINKSLYEATDMEKGTTVKLLLQKFKADPDAKGEEYGNALTAAAYDGASNGDIVRLLLDADANPNAANGYALQAAAAQGHYEVVEELIRRHADVNAITTNENCESGTALQAACEAGQLDIVQLLLKHGANANLGCGSASPPIIAAAQGDARILKELIMAKADVNVVGGFSNSSALLNAAAYLPYESVQILVDAGANVNLPNDEGDTPLIWVAYNGDIKSVAYLLDHGADILHSNNNNENALQTALAWVQETCAKLLADCLSVLFEALRKVTTSGDTNAAAIVQNMKVDFQAMELAKKYIEDDETSEENEDQPETTDSNLDPDRTKSEGNDVQEIEEADQTNVSPSQLSTREDTMASGTKPANNDPSILANTQQAATSEEQGSSTNHNHVVNQIDAPADNVTVYSQRFLEKSQLDATIYDRNSPGYSQDPSWERPPEIIRPHQLTLGGGSEIKSVTPPHEQLNRQSSPFDPNARSGSISTPLAIRRKPAPSIYPPAPHSDNLNTTDNDAHAPEYVPYWPPAESVPPINQISQEQSYSYNQSQPEQLQPFQPQDVAPKHTVPGYDRIQYSDLPQRQAPGSNTSHNATPARGTYPYQQIGSPPVTPQSFQNRQSAPEQIDTIYNGHRYGSPPRYQAYSAATQMRPDNSQWNQRRNWQNTPTQQYGNYHGNGQPARTPQYDGEDWG